MKRREAVAALVVSAVIILALLAVFAVELSNNQAQSKSNIESQAHQNALLVAGLIDSVFGADQPAQSAAAGRVPDETRPPPRRRAK